MTQEIIHLSPAKRVNGRKPNSLTGAVMDMEGNKRLDLTPYEAGEIAGVVSSGLRRRREQVVYLHREETPERTANASVIDLKANQPLPLNPEASERIAAVVKRIEEIEASGEHEGIKQYRRAGLTGQPLEAKDRNQI